MLKFFTTMFPSIMALVTVLLGLVLVWIRQRRENKIATTGKDSESLKNADEALTKIYSMLPGLITFSETMNSGKSGAIKKDFVLNYIKNTFAMMNVEIDEASLTAISSAIDDIVSATKVMHTGAKAE